MSSHMIIKGEFIDLELWCKQEIAQIIVDELISVIRKHPVTVNVTTIEEYERDD